MSFNFFDFLNFFNFRKLSLCPCFFHRFSPLMRHPCQASARLLQYAACVATTSAEKTAKSWNGTYGALTLHQKSDMTPLFDLLLQSKFKCITPGTFRAYSVSPAPAETQKGRPKKKVIKNKYKQYKKTLRL